MVKAKRTVTWDDALRHEVWLAMGYGGAVPEERVRDAVEEIAARLVPLTRLRYMYDLVPAEKLSAKQVRLGGKEFTAGGIIGSYLKGMTGACIFVATAGAEFDAQLRALKAEGDIFADYIADSIGSVLAEHAVSLLEQELNEGLDLGVSLPYSPGYCGWDIREQQIFFTLSPPQPCGITLSASSLMSPEKSISGFFALGAELVKQPYHCDICQNQKCFKRKNASLSR